jgi:proteasome accessory factor C
MSASADRLPRLLALVPYLLAHPESRLSDVAAEFDVSERQLRDDLDLIFVCGLPGHTPADLMEVDIVEDRITLTNADTLARPLRLSAEEGLALVVALRTMVGVPSYADPVRRALAKLEAAVEDAAEPGVDVVVEAPGGEVLERVQQALQRRKRLRLRYHVASRDEVTERDVDPILVTTVEGRYYLEGYCRLVEDLRVFRVDRILEARVLDTDAEIPADIEVRDLGAGVYQPAPGDLAVKLALKPEARWVADYYPCESVEERSDGGLDVSLRTPDLGWVARVLLSLGAAASVVEPPQLAEAVHRQAAETLAAYGR